MQLATIDIEDATDNQIRTPEPVAKRGRGRPATITLDLIQKVGTLIARGLTEEQACLRVGINHHSFRTARQRNPEFELAIKRAQADFLDSATESISKGARGWQGLAWILERRHGDQFRRNTGVEVSGPLAAFNPVDALLKKPLVQWTEVDVRHSVGAWKLLRQWSPGQLEELTELYRRFWGPEMNRWPDEQLDWFIEIGKAIDGGAKQFDVAVGDARDNLIAICETRAILVT